MKNRNVIRFVCVLLLVLLLCAIGPAAWADEGGAPKAPDAPAVSREQMLLDYMACVMAADKAQTQAEQEQMLRAAEEIWQNYSDMLRGQWAAAEPEPAPAEAEAVRADADAAAQLEELRTELLTYYLLYRDAAFAEPDPHARAALFAEADDIWDAYMSLVMEGPVPVKTAEQPAAEQPAAEQPVAEQPVAEQPAAEQRAAAEQPVVEQPAAEQPAAAGQPVTEETIKAMREELLAYYLMCMDAAEYETDPHIREMLYADAEELWDAYINLVFSGDASKPAAEPAPVEPAEPAAAKEPAAAAEPPATDDIDALREQLLTCYLLYLDAAAAEQDPYVCDELYGEADAIWDAYMSLVFGEEPIAAAEEPAPVLSMPTDEVAALREQLLAYYLLYLDAAEAERDPYAREALYADADALWSAYMDLVFSEKLAADAVEDIYLDSYDPYLADLYGADTGCRPETHAHGGSAHHHHKPANVPGTAPVPAREEDPYTDSELPAPADQPVADMTNPWTQTDSLEEAARISGIALDPPAAEALPGNLQLQHYRAMDGTIEADYASGEDELMIRASLTTEGSALSGDYNSYSKQWKENIKGLSVRCLGDGEKINVATFRRGELAFALNAAPGLTAGELRSVVLGMQAKPYAGPDAGIIGSADEATAIPVTEAETAAPDEIVVNYVFVHSDENGTAEQSGTFTLPAEPTAAAPAEETLEPAVPAETAAPGETAAPAETAAPTAETDGGAVVTGTDYTLAIHDPYAVDADGKPVRLVRIGETNLGDLCADALRAQANADIGIIDGGAICADLAKGDITDADIEAVLPYGDNLCLIAASGQQILDALEWGSRAIPYEFGGFLQVSGLNYEIHSYIDSNCVVDENGQFAGVDGERRVKNVTVGGEALNPERVYLVAGPDFLLLNNGGGNTAFQGAIVLRDEIKPNTQAVIDYLIDNLGGIVGEQYADPYGVGRIVVYEVAPTQAEQAPAAAEADAPAQIHTDVKKAPSSAKHPKISIKAA